MFKFDEKNHKYTYGERELTSVTTFIKKHFPEFDTKKISKLVAKARRNKGEKNNKGKPITAWDVRKEWKLSGEKASSAGSLTHYEIEEYIRGNIDDCVCDVFTPKAKQAIKWLYKSPLTNSSMVAEKKIYDLELGLAGTIDLLCVREGSVTLVDWKTNKAISKKSKARGSDAKGFAGLPNANYYHYQLQLTLYAYLLERKGYKIDELLLVHLLDDGVVVYEMDYNKKIIEEMLNESTHE